MKLLKNISFACLSAFALLLQMTTKVSDIHLYGGIGLLAIVIFLLTVFYQKTEEYHLEKEFILLGLFFACCMIVGNSLKEVHHFSYLFATLSHFLLSCVSLFGYTLLFGKLLSLGYSFLTKEGKKKYPTNFLIRLFDNHPFVFTCICLFLCYLIYMIAFYPAILSPDPSNQIKQFFGLETKYLESVIQLDPHVFLTNHHPVFQTFLMGWSIQLGEKLIDFNFGLFIYTFVQTCVLVATLAYTIVYMKKLNMPFSYRLIILLLYAFLPVFPLYGMSMVKDTYFTCFVILYTIQIFEMLTNPKISWKRGILFFLITAFMILFRNNGIHIFLLSFPVLCWMFRKYWKSYGVLLLSVFVFYFSYQNVFLPAMKIPDGSIREMLSIPFQQTARYVVYHEEEVTEKERKAIDQILGYDTLKDRYQENISDPVKAEFNKYATTEDLKNYFLVWYQQFWKHPVTYMEATALNTYGYFYPNTKKWYVYYKYDTRLQESGFAYSYNSLSGLRDTLSKYAKTIPSIPIFRFLVNIGIGTWMVFALAIYTMKQKKKYYLPIFLPSFILILVCIASPVNTYYRYAMPYLFSLPLLISMVRWMSGQKFLKGGM